MDPVQVEGVQDLLLGELLILGLGLEPLEESGPLDVVGPHPGPLQQDLDLGRELAVRQLLLQHPRILLYQIETG